MSTTTTISLTLVSTTPQARPGELHFLMTAKKGRQVWRYVKNNDAATAWAAGHAITFPNGTDEYDEVKLHPAGATAAANRCVGVAQHAIAAQSYGWILVEGEGTVLADTGGITANTSLILGNAVAGAVDSAGAATDASIGFAHTAITAAATGSAKIHCVY